MKHHRHNNDPNHHEEEEEGSGSEEEEEKEEEEGHEEQHQQQHNPNAPAPDGLVATLLRTAQMQEWEAFRQEVAAARPAVQEKEVRLAAIKKVEETRTRELGAIHAKLRGLQHELDDARKAANKVVHADSVDSEAPDPRWAGELAKLKDLLAGQKASV